MIIREMQKNRLCQYVEPSKVETFKDKNMKIVNITTIDLFIRDISLLYRSSI